MKKEGDGEFTLTSSVKTARRKTRFRFTRFCFEGFYGNDRPSGKLWIDCVCFDVKGFYWAEWRWQRQQVAVR